MRITVTAEKPAFNARGFVTQFFKDLRHQYLLAAADFLEHAAEAVPIDTGMARGSFLNLLSLLEANGINISTDIPREPRRVQKGGGWGRSRGEKGRPFTYIHSDASRWPKTPQSAKHFSTPKGQAIKRVGDRMVFRYETRVLHYNINDESQWGSFRRGQNAFMDRIAQFRFPAVDKYIVLSTVSYGSEFDAGERLRVRQQRTIT